MSPFVARSVVIASCLAVLAAAAPAISAGDNAPAGGLKGQYFDNEDFTGSVVERVDPGVDFTWEGVSPAAGIEPHTFSIRWTGTVTPRYSERYTFTTRSDDGVRLWVNGQKVIDHWTDHSARLDSGEIDLQAGTPYDIKLEYYERAGRATIGLAWQSASQPAQTVPESRLQPPAVAAQPAPVATTPVTVPAPVTTAPVTTPVTPAPAAVPGPAPAPPEPAGAPPAVAELPPPSTPVAGKSFNAEPLRGEVLVRGTDGKLGRLGRAASLPVGARLDTRHGAVQIQTAKARNVHHRRQYARLSGTTFKVVQRAAGNRVVALDLTHGDFESCTRATPTASPGHSAARAAASKRRVVRKLFGRGKGRFVTRGRGASATVRGTFWIVEDTCDATIVRVRTGAVDVKDFRTGKTRTLNAGQQYTAVVGARRGGR
jgi:hypothetical protein